MPTSKSSSSPILLNIPPEYDIFGGRSEERSELLRKVRMYADYEQIEELLCDLGLKKLDMLHVEGSGHVIVFEK